MSASVTVSIDMTEAQRLILEADEALRTALGPVVEMAAMDAVQSHLDANYVGKPNKLGGPSTGYWTGVRNSVSAQTSTSGTTVQTTVSLTGPGLRMKLTGGIIKPTGRVSTVTGQPIKMLAIPMAAESHGKVPAMFGASLTRQGMGLYGPGGALLFRLARQAKIKPDPNILPPPAEVITKMGEAIAMLLEP